MPILVWLERSLALGKNSMNNSCFIIKIVINNILDTLKLCVAIIILQPYKMGIQIKLST